MLLNNFIYLFPFNAMFHRRILCGKSLFLLTKNPRLLSPFYVQNRHLVAFVEGNDHQRLFSGAKDDQGSHLIPQSFGHLAKNHNFLRSYCSGKPDSENGSSEWTEEIEYLDESGSLICSGKGVRTVEPGLDDHVMSGGVKKPLMNASAVAKMVEIVKRWKWGPEMESQLDKLQFVPNMTHVIQAMKVINDGEMSVNLFQWAKRQPWYVPNDECYLLLLDGLNKNRDTDRMQSLFDEMIGDSVDNNGMSSFSAYNHANVAVVMVPFPAQGHLNQLLHLSLLISSYETTVHYVGSTSHNRQAKLRYHGWDLERISSSKIHFHDIKIPRIISSSSHDHDHLNTSTMSGHFPVHLHPIFHTLLHLHQPVSQLLHKLAAEFRRVVVIYDSLMASVVRDVKSIPNAEAYTFMSSSAFTTFISTLDTKTHDQKKLFNDAIPTCIIPSFEDCFPPDVAKYVLYQESVSDFQSGRLHNTFVA